MRYAAWIRSPEWTALRLRVLQCDGVRCGAGGGLELRDLDYVDPPESLDLLAAPCPGCHQDEHRRWSSPWEPPRLATGTALDAWEERRRTSLREVEDAFLTDREGVA